MVRIKHRYLLIDILHPEPSQIHKRGPSSSSSSSIPAHLYFHPPTPDSLTSSVLARLLRETISELFGDYGIGKLGGASSGNLIVKYLSPATSTAIIRCPRAAYRLVWAALTYLNAIPVPPTTSARKSETTMRNAVFRVVRVSGTMRKAEEEAIRRARREIGRTKRENMNHGGVLDGLFGEKDGAAVVGDDEAVFGMDIDDDDEESDDEY
ncbi:hypothetical protein EYB26_002040 [Talaromyces marneffei]|uniref:uncharacterized protein n=1 Tax=Talaromyces marneffei TaxID=37727 RepID=UPI0012A99A9D|nr:uncharacterized protein EYB26_002040 [Talaromyces marneffei]QGA14387.1 hypothetical protein EYB26_002040 [Talaromyces marneffei]